MSQMFVNVIHRADAGPLRLEALRFQQAEAHLRGLKTTILVSFSAFFDPEVVAYIRAQRDEYGDEVGIHLHELMCAEYRARFETEEKAFWLLPADKKRGVLDFLIERYRDAFAAEPCAIGSYIIDADTLNHLHARHPSVKVAIINCFEEGVKMYQGNNQEWYLFSDGGPWGVYYPSKTSHLCPAHDEDESIGILGLPHLNRDMVLSLTSRDDHFASHPANLVRGKANVGNRCDYLLHFIDQWIEQLRYNRFVYYSLFVSTPWIAPGHPFVDDHRDARRLYSETLAYLRDRQDAGVVRCVTMSAFADWHRTTIKRNQPEVNLWNDILCGSRRQMFWHIDSYWRVAIDLNAGGAICDLRPYVGRINCDVGPDRPNLWNGNHPFLISTTHRGGYRTGPTHTCEVHHGRAAILLSEAHTTANVTRAHDRIVVTTAPVTLRIGQLDVTIVSTYQFFEYGELTIERSVTALSEPDAVVELCELHRGCRGTTEYPEDLRGIVLRAEAAGGSGKSLVYNYQSRRLAVTQPAAVTAEIPQLRCRVALMPVGAAERGEVIEGYMFRPFYTLAISQSVRAGESLKCRLKLSKP